MVEELRRELSSGHVLSGVDVAAVARRDDNDDVLLRLLNGPAPHAVVHLTGSGRQEGDVRFPSTQLFGSLHEATTELD